MSDYIKLPPGEAVQRRAAGRRSLLDGLVAQMYADYLLPTSLAKLGRNYKRDRRGVRELFVVRGLKLRETAWKGPARQPNGTFTPAPPLSDEQIAELVATATKLYIPPALKLEWRSWPMERRADFIRRVRARLQSPEDRPTTQFSSNVEPFDYFSPAARAIVDRLNANRTSHQAFYKLKLRSQGVIYRDRLFFWARKVGYTVGPWVAGEGRPILHHVIYEEQHGKIPAAHCVRFADGNHNNFSPDNLVLLTRDDVARENQGAALMRKARARTALLLKRSEQKDEHYEIGNSLLITSR